MLLEIKKLICVCFCAFLGLFGFTSLLKNAHLRAGMIKHSFFCSCCSHGTFSDEWSKVARFLEKNVGETVLCAETLVSVNGAFHFLLCRQTIYDAVYQHIVKNAQGRLWYPIRDGQSSQDRNVTNVLKIREAMEPGTRFLVVIAPNKAAILEGSAPPGIQSFSNANIDLFTSLCRSNGIACLDLREIINTEAAFYKTDHHWTTPTAFNVSVVLNDWLQRNGVAANEYNPAVDPTQYETRLFRNCFLGSEGRRTGRWFAGLDDYELMVPKFATQVRVKALTSTGRTVEKRGSFEETIIHKEYYENVDVSCNRYGSYWGADHALVKVWNNGDGEGRLLVIKDSFALPVAAFLSLVMRETSIIDIRLYRNHGSVCDYVSNNHHDAIILLYNAGMLADTGMFDFDGSAVVVRRKSKF